MRIFCMMVVFGVFILRQAQDEGGLRVSREVAMLADMQFSVLLGAIAGRRPVAVF